MDKVNKANVQKRIKEIKNDKAYRLPFLKGSVSDWLR